jgi:hypothetical protein
MQTAGIRQHDNIPREIKKKSVKNAVARYEYSVTDRRTLTSAEIRILRASDKKEVFKYAGRVRSMTWDYSVYRMGRKDNAETIGFKPARNYTYM